MQVKLVTIVICPAKHMEQRRRLHDSFRLPPSYFRNARVHIFQKVVGVTDADPNDIHRNGAPNQHTKREHDPRKIRSIKVNETQETHFDRLVSSAPYVGHHESQGATQKVNVGIGCHQGNLSNAKQKHPNVFRCLLSEFAFFE